MSSPLVAAFRKSFTDGPSLRFDFTASPDRGSITVVLGQSGSGKTTLLKCLAGLIRPDQGTIDFGLERWFDAAAKINLTPRRRRIGFCFQRPALYDHLNVWQNIAFGLPRRERRLSVVGDSMRALQIDDLAERRVDQISGGQAQRVAIARALMVQPRWLLLDEPFVSLDSGLRQDARRWLRQTLRRTGTSAIVVSHDREEAIALADQMAIVGDRRVLQSGPPADVFAKPINATVADMVGVETVLRGTVIDSQSDVLSVRVGQTIFKVVADFKIVAEQTRVRDDVTLCIHGDAVTLFAERPEASTSFQNCFAGEIETIEPSTNIVRVRIAIAPDVWIVASITRSAMSTMQLSTGQRVTAAIKATAIHVARD